MALMVGAGAVIESSQFHTTCYPKGRFLIMAKALEVTDNTFEQEVLQSTQPVLVDFWAAWCGPCRAVAPIVEELAGEYEGRLKVMKLDVDDNPRTASAYGVQSIPTLLVFKDGKPAERIIGAVPKKVIADKLQSVMA
jgi:thioredoxin 1